MDTVQQRMAAIFNEWVRRALADPEILGTYWKGLDMPTDDYGEQCAKYFTDLAAEMDADGLLPVPEPQEPTAWQNTNRPTEIFIHEQLDPLWYPEFQPLFKSPPDVLTLIKTMNQLGDMYQDRIRRVKEASEVKGEAIERLEAELGNCQQVVAKLLETQKEDTAEIESLNKSLLVHMEGYLDAQAEIERLKERLKFFESIATKGQRNAVELALATKEGT